MAELKITDNSGELRNDAVAWTFAAMLYPTNRHLQTECVTTHTLVTLQENDDLIPPDILKHANLNLLQGWRGQMDRPTANLAIHGLNAGGILIFFLRCARHAPEHASLSKAQYIAAKSNIISEFSKKYPLSGITSQRSIQSLWSEYKSVSHLWAANICYPEGIEGGNFFDFLAIAKTFALAGTNHLVPRKKSTPILDASTLLIPPSLSLPEIELNLPSLSNEEIEFLNKYKKDSI